MQRHGPELYESLPVAAGVRDWEAVGEAEIAHYRTEGFLVIEAAFTPEEVEAAHRGLEDLILGRIPDFTHIEYEAEAADLALSLPPERREAAVRKLMSFGAVEPRLRYLAEHPELLEILARLLEATPERFQDMALLKPPRLGREKPWHQDHAYFELPLGTPIVGVWIALDEATLENGCMHLLPGGHRDGPRQHVSLRDWQICDQEVLGRSTVAVPLRPGGLLLFDGLLPHGTPHNDSPHRRRAVQYHYRPADAARITKDEHMALFGDPNHDPAC